MMFISYDDERQCPYPEARNKPLEMTCWTLGETQEDPSLHLYHCIPPEDENLSDFILCPSFCIPEIEWFFSLQGFKAWVLLVGLPTSRWNKYSTEKVVKNTCQIGKLVISNMLIQ